MSAGAALQAGHLARNLLAGVRLALFLPVRAEAFRASPVQFALLVLFNFSIWVGAAAVRTDLEGEFQSWAIVVYLASVALVLATALLVALAYRAPERLMLFAVALSSSDAVFDLAALALVTTGVVDIHPTLFYVAFVAWAWLVSLRATVACGGWARPHVYLAAFAVSAMTVVALWLIPETNVWELPDDDDEDTIEARAVRTAQPFIAAPPFHRTTNRQREP